MTKRIEKHKLHVKVTLTTGEEIDIPFPVFRSILSSAESMKRLLKREERSYLPEIDQRALDAIMDLRARDPRMV